MELSVLVSEESTYQPRALMSLLAIQIPYMRVESYLKKFAFNLLKGLYKDEKRESSTGKTRTPRRRSLSPACPPQVTHTTLTSTRIVQTNEASPQPAANCKRQSVISLASTQVVETSQASSAQLVLTELNDCRKAVSSSLASTYIAEASQASPQPPEVAVATSTRSLQRSRSRFIARFNKGKENCEVAEKPPKAPRLSEEVNLPRSCAQEERPLIRVTSNSLLETESSLKKERLSVDDCKRALEFSSVVQPRLDIAPQLSFRTESQGCYSSQEDSERANWRDHCCVCMSHQTHQEVHQHTETHQQIERHQYAKNQQIEDHKNK